MAIVLSARPMTSRRTLIVLAGLVTLGACGVHAVSTTISRQNIGSKYARLTGYFATRGAAPGGKHTESTPGSIRHEVIRDEATLVSMNESESCFDVVMRMGSRHDEPFDQLEPTCEVDGQEARAVVENELVSIYDYSYEGSRNIVDVQGVTATEYFGLQVTEPTERVFRVIERQGRICCPLSGSNVALDMTHPEWTFADYNYHLVFNWKIK